MRRGSVTSLSSRAGVDKETLTQALDDIHASASRSAELTAFNEFAPPPSSAGSDDRGFVGNLVPNTLGGIYQRLKTSVGASNDKPSPSLAPRHRDRARQSPEVADCPATQTYSGRPVRRSGGDVTPSKPPTHLRAHSDLSLASLSISDRVESSSRPSVRGEDMRLMTPKRIGSPNLFASQVSQQSSPESPPQADDVMNIGRAGKPEKTMSQEVLLSGSATKSSGPPQTIANYTTTDVASTHSVTAAKEAKDTESIPQSVTPPILRASNVKSETALRQEVDTAKPIALTRLAMSAGTTANVMEVHTKGDISPLRPGTNVRDTRTSVEVPSPAPASGKIMREMRRKVLSRDFWMKDENAKVCFSCGDSFTTFRRKHHCRTCGQIYDAKCTVLISGKAFGQAGRLRICKTCEHIIVGDDSSDFSEDEGPPSTSHSKMIRFSGIPPEDDKSEGRPTRPSYQAMHSSTSSLRNIQDLRRRVVAGVLDGSAPSLSRPSSSRSLKSLGARPRSSSHRYRKPRHQHMRSLGTASDAAGAFHNSTAEDGVRVSLLPTFHTDAIIDPDLAPFLSDEGSSDEEQQSIATALHGSSMHRNIVETGRDHAAMKRPKSRPMSSRSFIDAGSTGRDADTMSISSSRPPTRRRRPTRTLSTASVMSRPELGLHTSYSMDAMAGENPYSAYGDYSQPTRVGDQSKDSPVTMSAEKVQTPLAELDKASLQHVRALLKQFLRDAKVPRAAHWVKVLVPILLRCAEEIDPNIQRGDDIDIRHYVKLKKASSGKPADTSYVSGVVFTSNVALKSMARKVSQARILILSFPLVYARHKHHFMSLDPVIAQEREYLRNLVRRITSLRPSVVLVQANVAGLALEFLQDAGVTVVCNVKASVLQAISRCTQTRIVTSLDKLSMDPSQLGQCEMFDFRTFVYDGIKKTYAYVSGCKKDLGCTVILRGASLPTLRNLKWITEFMCLAVYSLKLENSLIRDQFLSATTHATESTSRKDELLNNVINDQAGSSKDGDSNVVADATRDSQDVSELTESVGERQLISAGTNDNLSRHSVALEYHLMVEKLRTRVLSISPAVKLADPYLLVRGSEQEKQMVALRDDLQEAESLGGSRRVADDENMFEIIRPEMIHGAAHTASARLREALKDIRRSEYDKATTQFAGLKRRWEAYVAGTIDPFSPLSHQQIVVLFSIISTPSSYACEGPDLVSIEFYQEQDLGDGLEADVPLGEYVERLCDQAHMPCTVARCDKKMIEHHRQYVHGDGQVNISVQKCRSKLRGFDNVMLMWSICRECQQETPAVSMSSNTWKFSFAKYLELTFWSRPLPPRAGICPHDVNMNHIRYFGFNNLAVSVQYEAIRILEVIVPCSSISWKVEKDVSLKNDEYFRIQERMQRFLKSVSTRVDSINPLNVKPENLEGCRHVLESFRKRVAEDSDFLTKKLQDKYSNSEFYEIVPLNRAVRAMQEKVASWDRAFADFEQKYFPSEKDIRKLAAQQLKNAYLTPEELRDTDLPLAEVSEKQADTTVAVDDTAKEEKLLSGLDPSQGGVFTEEPESDHDLNILNEVQPSEIVIPNTLRPPTATHRASNVVQHLDLATPVYLTRPSTHDADIRSIDTEPHDEHRHSKEPVSLEPVWKDTEAARPPLHDNEPRNRDMSQPVYAPLATENATSGVTAPAASQAQSSQHDQVAPPPLLRSQTQPSPLRHGQQSPEGSLEKISSDITATRSARHIPIPVHAKTTHASRSKAKDPGQSSKITTVALKTGKSALKSMLPHSLPRSRPDSRVSALARHFEQMSREFERERLRDRRQRAARVRQAQVYTMASYQPMVEVFEDATEAVEENEPTIEQYNAGDGDAPSAENEDFDLDRTVAVVGDGKDVDSASITEPGETIKSEESTLPPSGPPSESEDTFSDAEQTLSNELEDVEGKLGEDGMSPEARLEFLDIAKHDKTSIMKMLTSFWSERSASGWTALDYPLSSTDHIFADSDVIVREDEPSSLIAFALASQDYRSKLQRFRERAKIRVTSNQTSGDTDVERTLLGDTATHMKYQFQAGPARMQCKVFYAESFDAIRRVCGVSDRFVESLSRCLKWDSRGGKTKSIFLKTLDDRFVIKSLSTVETQAFLRFAPDYFDYMSKCLFHSLPSALAKMLGFYQVIIKNPVTGIDFVCFFQVMENIFYEGPSNRMFDLKGSMRNRKVQSTGEKDEVLLDENLLDYISQAPVYVRNHSMGFLASSISNDTLFCSKQNVMDYSLIVGLYDDRQELMVGIIDYIRTYTWDKKLESWIKDRGKNKPTVRSPKEYRNRFRASISRYFPLAPSCWQLAKPERAEQPTAAWWDSLGVYGKNAAVETEVRTDVVAEAG